MANQIPMTGLTNIGGQYLIPPEQGKIIVDGILVETGALQLSGDLMRTNARKVNFPIWLGRPTAAIVGEGAKVPATGAAFGQGTLNVKKFGTSIFFTDELLEDVQNGDLSLLADAGMQQAIAVAIDANAVGLSAGALIAGGPGFDSSYVPRTGGNTNAVQITAANLEVTGVQEAVSSAIGVLEGNGYGNPANIGVLSSFGVQEVVRNARDGFKRPLYSGAGNDFGGQVLDAFYGLARAHSTNLPSINHAPTTLTVKKASAKATKLVVKTRGTAPLFVGQPLTVAGSTPVYTIVALVGGQGVETEIEISAELEAEAAETAVVTLKQPVIVLVHRPNLHVRQRNDVYVKISNEATFTGITTEKEAEETTEQTLSAFEENLTIARYTVRTSFLIHDQARAVVPIWA